jgi:hypothetical protein
MRAQTLQLRLAGSDMVVPRIAMLFRIADAGGRSYQAHLFEWLRDHYIGTSDEVPKLIAPDARAPQSHECTVAINPQYRFIYIKNTKTGGSSTMNALGGFCPWNQQVEVTWPVRFLSSVSVLCIMACG